MTGRGATLHENARGQLHLDASFEDVFEANQTHGKLATGPKDLPGNLQTGACGQKINDRAGWRPPAMFFVFDVGPTRLLQEIREALKIIEV